ncbi:MAG: hypothetical protein J0M23_06650 [Rickettsiales bacterium]|nr:hypothetical protein [Rickettsiales bacterium]
MPIVYNSEQDQVWQALITQQLPLVLKVACKEYIEGLKLLNLPGDKIPELSKISSRLTNLTGWSLVPVNMLIPNKKFFYMLAEKKFPVVTVIRSKDELDFYTNESPDIFHELFGHCPLITNEKYANYMCKFAKLALTCNDKMLNWLAKVFWATFEFGLLNTNKGIKIYGAGILPSKSETLRVIEDKVVCKIKLNIFSEIKASLKGNIAQPTYYIVDSLENLYSIIDNDIEEIVNRCNNSQTYLLPSE